MMTLGVFVSRFDGDRGSGLCKSLMVIGREFTMGHTSINNGYSDSSSRLFQLFPCVLINALRIDLAVLIFLSQTPPTWLVAGGFRSQIIEYL